MKCEWLLGNIYTAMDMASRSFYDEVVIAHIPAYSTRKVFKRIFRFPPELYDRMGTAEVAIEFCADAGDFRLSTYWYGSNEWTYLTRGTERDVVKYILTHFENFITEPVKFAFEGDE